MMLLLDGDTFATGRARFLDISERKRESSAKIFVPIRVDGIDLLAQLDTGAPWSILPTEVCEGLNLTDGRGQMARLSTRKGVLDGRLERVTLTLVASEGVSLDIEATIFVVSDWDDDAFIGWSGLLERVRVAIDPAPQANYFYFGPVV
jgi:hypothetical protein